VTAYAAEDLSPALVALADRISDAVGSNDDPPWRTQSVKRLGHGAVDRALGQLKEAPTGFLRPQPGRPPD
jgi:hypothetical protein